jgi:NADP-reducing hydrogenase subunit HndB
MKRLTLQDLRALRERKKAEIARRATSGATGEVIVGMGTCGIAAGARAAFDAFVDELSKGGLTHVVVKQTGCMGLCYSEPTVEVRMPGMPAIVYGAVGADIARKIVQEHILGGRLVGDHVFDKPAVDLAPTLGRGTK